MKFPVPALFILIAIFTLAACSSIPIGPSVLVLPGSEKSFDQFQTEDNRCRQYAFTQINGNASDRAAIRSGYEAQHQYDMSFIQCMFANGNRVPVSGSFVDENRPDFDNQSCDSPSQ